MKKSARGSGVMPCYRVRSFLFKYTLPKSPTHKELGILSCPERGSVAKYLDSITFNGNTYAYVAIELDVYIFGGHALSMLTEYGELLARVSAFVEDDPPDEGCIWVKNYSENSGIQEALCAAGILELTGRTVKTGFVELQEGRIVDIEGY